MQSKGSFLTSFDGTRIHYVYKKNTKPCIVFLHGLTGGYRAWEPFYEHFYTLGHSILAMDMRGHGYSDKPEKKEQYTIPAVVNDLTRILEKENIRQTHVVGHCYGSYVAITLAAMHPAMVKKLVLTSTHHKLQHDWRVRLVNPPHMLLLKVLRKFQHTKQYMQNDYISLRGLQDYHFHRVLKLYKVCSYDTVINFSESTLQYDIPPLLAKVTTPTLIIAGDRDLIVPKSITYDLHRHIKNSQLLLYSRINHQPTLNAWKQYKKDITTFITS